MILIILSATILFIFFSITIFNMILGPYLKQGCKFSLSVKPTVSVLIPARNEQDNIKRCINSFIKQSYPVDEIIILDDHSQDRTAEIIEEMVQIHKSVKYLPGESLPENWLGKNWACWQLAGAARSEVLVFADADTWHDQDAIRASIGWMQKFNLNLLSAFPQQIEQSFWERLLIPIIDLILYTFLPLWAVYYIPGKAFSAANGQWMVYTRDAYDQTGGHLAVRDKVVEDVELARLAKQNRIRMMTTAGTGMVYCRMYRNLSEIWHGLTKIMYGLTGNKWFVLLFFLAIFGLAYILPCLLLFSDALNFMASILIFIILVHRLFFSLIYRHNILINMLLFPLSVFLGMIIAVNSLYQLKYGSYVWKSRDIKIN